MDIGRRLPRHLGQPAELDVGQWCLIRSETIAGHTQTVWLRCWNCGKTVELGSMYRVLPHSGLVSPRWQCPTATCSVLERVQLEAYE